MSATEELRRLLDEHGVEWGVPEEWCGVLGDDIKNYVTTVGNLFITCGDGLITVYGLTVEQVVEATVGRETCHNISEPPEEGFWPMPRFECSACGKYYVTSDYVYFCPSCGRRVVQP